MNHHDNLGAKVPSQDPNYNMMFSVYDKPGSGAWAVSNG